jgi:hypothetical protein
MFPLNLKKNSRPATRKTNSGLTGSDLEKNRGADFVSAVLSASRLKDRVFI